MYQKRKFRQKEIEIEYITVVFVLMTAINNTAMRIVNKICETNLVWLMWCISNLLHLMPAKRYYGEKWAINEIFCLPCNEKTW